jgi:hypothetical protein
MLCEIATTENLFKNVTVIDSKWFGPCSEKAHGQFERRIDRGYHIFRDSF